LGDMRPEYGEWVTGASYQEASPICSDLLAHVLCRQARRKMTVQTASAGGVEAPDRERLTDPR